MHRVTFPWELKLVNTTDDCADAGGCMGGTPGCPSILGSGRFTKEINPKTLKDKVGGWAALELLVHAALVLPQLPLAGHLATHSHTCSALPRPSRPTPLQPPCCSPLPALLPLLPLQTRRMSCLRWWCTWGRTPTTVGG